MLLLLLAFLALDVSADSISQEKIVARVAEEAEAFQENITNAVSQETFEQRAAMPASRFHPRIGAAASTVPKARLQVRQVVSEYSVGTFRETASRDLHEFRQVISVDGRTVQSAEDARHALSLGIRAEDDRIRKRMLENFAKFGLVDIATDYGLILLEFTHRGLANIDIQAGPTTNIGADTALALLWRQKTETGGQVEFAGRRTVRQPLHGTLWVRESDGLPLRVEAAAEYLDNGHTIADRAAVEYVESAHGFLAPASVVHRHFVDGRLLTENTYRYQPFKTFGADAEIKFTELPDAPSAGAPNPPVKK